MYASDGPNERIQAIIDQIDLNALFKLLDSDTSLISPVLRVFGNIVTGNDAQTQIVIDLGIVSKIDQLLNSCKESIRVEACWLLSNISAGNNEQINVTLV